MTTLAKTSLTAVIFTLWLPAVVHSQTVADTSFTLAGAGLLAAQDEAGSSGAGGGWGFPDLPEGFLVGMKGFEGFPAPVSQPLYFEHPFITTEARVLYIWNKFSDRSTVAGGELQTWAVQLSLALSERLAFIATKDGYTKLHTGALPDRDGWNDMAFGLKYLVDYNVADQWALSGGLRWQISQGSSRVLQGNVDELSPFISVAKGWDKFHVLGSLYGRIPVDNDQGNSSIGWDVHFDYEWVKDFFPLIEFHGIHWLSDGDRVPFDIGGIDVANLGAGAVDGESIYWAAVGFRWQLHPHISLGTTYEFPLMDPDDDLLDHRLTTNIYFRY